MTVSIYRSSKFNYAHEQYYAVTSGHTVLRLTFGAIDGQPGGAFKSATASDLGTAPNYPDRVVLSQAMRHGVTSLGGRAQDVSIAFDGKGRRCAEIALSGSREQFIKAMHLLAERMERYLR
ncbi:hypothetical protein [Albirhodobacter sp. R86504]|uniref:hypothetical protein n=1 Tax=Albirhodobacter sp. R86504 TaxID=3093848 RepID=UPI00366FAB9E